MTNNRTSCFAQAQGVVDALRLGNGSVMLSEGRVIQYNGTAFTDAQGTVLDKHEVQVDIAMEFIDDNPVLIRAHDDFQDFVVDATLTQEETQ